jgi:hypothetical protein
MLRHDLGLRAVLAFLAAGLEPYRNLYGQSQHVERSIRFPYIHWMLVRMLLHEGTKADNAPTISQRQATKSAKLGSRTLPCPGRDEVAPRPHRRRAGSRTEADSLKTR